MTYRDRVRRTAGPFTLLRRVDPLVADGLLALMVGAVLEYDLLVGFASSSSRWDARAAAVLLAQAVPLAWRRRRPLAVFCAVAVATLAYTLLGLPPAGFGIALLAALYSVAAHNPRSAALAVLPLDVAVLAVGLAAAHPAATPSEAVVQLLVHGTAWMLGDTVRTHRAYAAELERRAERLANDRAEQARRAVDAERTRIARELHDVVAHHVSVIAVQAGGAAAVLTAKPERAQQAIDAISETARQALVELRRLLGVLRDEGDAAPSAPQPGLAAIEALVAEVRDAGVPVTLRIDGEPRPMPAGVDLSLYRIVQESLTNVLKHAGPAPTDVVVRWRHDEVELEVVDAGSGTDVPAVALSGEGHGLVGMRERAALFGGRLEAARLPGGGFRVHAVLPLAPDAEPTAPAVPGGAGVPPGVPGGAGVPPGVPGGAVLEVAP